MSFGNVKRRNELMANGQKLIADRRIENEK